jgi:MFS family permease
MASRSRPTGMGPVRGPSAPAIAAAGLTALAVAMGIGRFAFTPILPMMQQDTGLPVADGGWLASANYLGYLLGAVSVAALALRVRPATGIRGGLLVIGMATLGMGLETRFPGWIMLRALAGIATAWVLVFASAWCLEGLALARRPLLNGVVFAGVGTGIAVAGGFCLALMRLSATSAQAWIGLGVLSLAGTAVIWRLFVGAGENARVDEGRRSPPVGWQWDADSVRLVLCYGAFGFGYIIPGTFLPAMARRVIHDPLVFGWAWPVFGVAAAVSTLAAVVWSRRIGNRRLWLLGHLVMAFGVALPAWWPGIGSIMIAALLVGGTFMVITLAGMQEARVVAGPQAARLMAAMTSAFAVGQIAGPICVSYLVGPDADLSGPLLAACLVLLVSVCGLLRFRRRECVRGSRR